MLRTGVWQMNKALNTNQSITDGSTYEPWKVNRMKTELKKFHKPSLDALSKLNWTSHKSVERVNLADRDWKTIISRLEFDDIERVLGSELNVDLLALSHIKEFWKVFDLDFTLNLEHKLSNTAIKTAYFNKGDYALRLLDNTIKYKIRGTKDFKDGLVRHPKYELLTAILEGLDVTIKPTEYHHISILKINKYRTIANSREDAWLAFRGKRPGDTVIEKRRKPRYNNTHFPIKTIREFQNRSQRTKKADAELFENYSSQSIEMMVNCMAENKLRSANYTTK